MEHSGITSRTTHTRWRHNSTLGNSGYVIHRLTVERQNNNGNTERAATEEKTDLKYEKEKQIMNWALSNTTAPLIQDLIHHIMWRHHQAETMSRWRRSRLSLVRCEDKPLLPRQPREEEAVAKEVCSLLIPGCGLQINVSLRSTRLLYFPSVLFYIEIKGDAGGNICV